MRNNNKCVAPLTKMPNYKRLIKCKFCKKYIFLTPNNLIQKHYRHIAKNIICEGSNQEYEVE